MTTTRTRPKGKAVKSQTATFYIGDLLLGLPIEQVKEINRHVNGTRVPHAPPSIRGVINLRGDVVTVIDLPTVLGLARSEITKNTRNVVIQSQNQTFGLLVDRIADVIAISADQIDSTPANVRGVDGRFFKGVYTLPTEIVVLLDIDQVIDEC